MTVNGCQNPPDWWTAYYEGPWCGECDWCVSEFTATPEGCRERYQ